MKKLIHNISMLAQVREAPLQKPTRGEAFGKLSFLEDAWILLEDDRIADFGTGSPEVTDIEQRVDARRGIVMPSFIDSHTHLVFAASREKEFVQRIKGWTYQQIAAEGGGILNSARKLRETSEDELFESARKRLSEVIKMGTGAIEIKSGYGLSLEAEIKMLKVIQRLKASTGIPVKASFLGAHALPMAYKNNREQYLDIMLNEALPIIAEQQLADYIDVFCEDGFFTLKETERILEAGLKYDLKGKIHTNQFTCSGAISAAIEAGAISVDHLEIVNDDEIRQLSESNIIATLLPSAPFFLDDEHRSPARKMIDSGVAIALASDYNPGSSPSGNLAFVWSLACVQLKMTPVEALNALTSNAAFALGLHTEYGAICKGYKANLILSSPAESIDWLPYAFGTDWIQEVWINGKARMQTL